MVEYGSYAREVNIDAQLHCIYFYLSMHSHTFLQMFLNEHRAAQHLMCWMDIEAFRGIPARNKHLRNLRAQQLREKYFTRKYLLGPDSPASKEAQRQVWTDPPLYRYMYIP